MKPVACTEPARQGRRRGTATRPGPSLHGKEEEEGQSEGLHQACMGRKKKKKREKKRCDLERVARMFQKR